MIKNYCLSIVSVVWSSVALANEGMDFVAVAEMFSQCYGTAVAAEIILTEGGLTQNAQVIRETGNGAFMSAAHLLYLNDIQAGRTPKAAYGDYRPYINSIAEPFKNRILAERELSEAAGTPEAQSAALESGLATCQMLSELQVEIVSQIRQNIHGVQ